MIKTVVPGNKSRFIEIIFIFVNLLQFLQIKGKALNLMQINSVNFISLYRNCWNFAEGFRALLIEEIL
jgi:hypothetical protein